MRRFILYLLVVLICFPVIHGEDQEFSEVQEEGVLYEKVLEYLPYNVSASQLELDAMYCKVLMIGAANFEPSYAEWAILDFAAEYFEGDEWNMCLVAVNYSSQPVPIKVEFELRWWWGARKIYRRWSRTIQPATVMLYMTPITTQIKQLGLFTLIGRISGKYVGTDNVVKTQLYIY